MCRPMITTDYVHMMARYNSWQGRQLRVCYDQMCLQDGQAWFQDRGGFFGGIHGTLNHLLWGDLLWLGRFDGGAPPDVGLEASVTLSADGPSYWAARAGCDRRLSQWVDTLTDEVLAGDLTWHSVVLDQTMSRPLADCVVHFFNHQTHHRGQVHDMISQAGGTPPVSDVILMPEED